MVYMAGLRSVEVERICLLLKIGQPALFTTSTPTFAGMGQLVRNPDEFKTPTPDDHSGDTCLFRSDGAPDRVSAISLLRRSG